MTEREGRDTRRMAVIGMFDGVHRGHRYLLGELKREASLRGLSPLAITFSNHPLELIAPEKAPRLLTDTTTKLRLIAGEGVEGSAIAFDNELMHTSAEYFLRMLHDRYGVDALMMGYNNRFGHNAPEDFEAYRALGKTCGVDIVAAKEYSPEGLAISSTEIRRLLEQGDTGKAAELLGRDYTLTGTVESGRQLGRHLGFPTANLRLSDPRLLVPAPGVYATTTMGYPAMTNIGVRPTVDNSGTTTIETHIIGYDNNLYGSTLTISFRRRIRHERHFSSLEELVGQLENDRREALSASQPSVAATDGQC